MTAERVLADEVESTGPRLRSGGVGPRERLRALPLRVKVLVTALGTGVAVLGASTWLSFRYWHGEARSATEQQALLAAGATRTAVESALRTGRLHVARRNMRELLEGPSVTGVRVYGSDGRVLLSTDPGEEGVRRPGRWIPSPGDLPPAGLVREPKGGGEVRVFLPLAVPGAEILEMVFSVAPVQQAMERGALLGIGLLLASVVALAVILFAMLEREVMAPLHTVDDLLEPDGTGTDGDREDEVRRIRTSVARLVERERRVEALAAEQDRQLAAQQGLVQVGELAAEMAHEFKRPLASIRSAVEMLREDYALGGAARTTLESVTGQLERLSDTMEDLFSLARPVVLETESVSLPDVLDDALVELSGYPGAGGVEVVRRYDLDVPDVAGDRRRLEQLVLNLMVNAVEAMDEDGTLTLEVRGGGPDAVLVTVSDTGCGMSSGELDRAFRPFHSTKSAGTGLGLPVVARIVRAHHGRIGMRSTPGKGTVVGVLLPHRPPLTGELPTWPESESSSWTMTASSEKSSVSG